MTDQDDFRPPRKPPWPLQQTQHHLMQSDLETARQRIQQPPKTTKPNAQATTAKTSMTPKRPKQEQRAPYTYPGIHIKQHLLSRAISAYNRTKDQGTEPEHKTNNQIRSSPRRNTTPKQNQNEEIRSKVQLHEDIQNQAIRATTQTTKPATRKNQTKQEPRPAEIQQQRPENKSNTKSRTSIPSPIFTNKETKYTTIPDQQAPNSNNNDKAKRNKNNTKTKTNKPKTSNTA